MDDLLQSLLSTTDHSADTRPPIQHEDDDDVNKMDLDIIAGCCSVESSDGILPEQAETGTDDVHTTTMIPVGRRYNYNTLYY